MHIDGTDLKNIVLTPKSYLGFAGKERKRIMDGLAIKEVENEQELIAVLELCYRILGENDSKLYGYDASVSLMGSRWSMGRRTVKSCRLSWDGKRVAKV